jgi:hypothetical protein
LPKLPTFGDIDHVTFGFVVPLSEALNCCAWLGVSEAEEGTTETDTEGTKVTTAEAVLVASAALVAVTVTVCCSAIVAGAV